MAYRRVPLSGLGGTASYSFVTVDVDCSGAPTNTSEAMCGLVVFNSATNLPVFTWGLITAGGTVGIRGDGYGGSTTTLTSNNGSAWNPSGVTLYLARTGNAGTPYTVAARAVGDTTDWSAVQQRMAVPNSLLDSDSPGSMWFGVIGTTAGNGSAADMGVARFTNFRLATTVPGGKPTDIYGAADVCMTSPSVQPQSVIVPGGTTTAVISGLSANFPYTVSVIASDGALESPPSAPLPGVYFWARRLPPRAQYLSLFLDSKWMPAASKVATWPDASGRGHTMYGRTATSTPPTAIRGSGYGSDFIGSGYVRFTRGAGTFLTGDGDGIDLGIAGDMTIYWIAVNRETATQVLLGRGSMATNLDYSKGWALGCNSIATDTLAGYPHLRVHDDNNTVAGAQVRGLVNTYNLIAMVTRNSSAPSAGTLGNSFSLKTCLEPSCTSGSPGVYHDPNLPWYPNGSVFTNKVSVVYNADPSGVAGLPAVAEPPISDDLLFRIGGQPTSSSIGNAALAYGGDVYNVAIYRESHDLATRTAVVNFLQSDLNNGFCPFSIVSTGVSSSGACTSGTNGGNCYQECASGYGGFLGVNRDHYCSNGFWTSPPLFCKRMCNEVLPPLYSLTCQRRYIEDSFNVVADPQGPVKYVTWPNLPSFERLVVWHWDTASGVLVARTSAPDACKRIRSDESILAPHPARWNTFAPPQNYLGTVTNVQLRLDASNSTAGVTFRTLDNNNHYRVEVTVSNITLVRLLGKTAAPYYTRTVLAIVNNNTITAGSWYNLTVTSKRTTLTVALNGVGIMGVVDPAYNPSYGPSGLYIGANSAASFDNLSVDIDCDLGNSARYMYEGMKLFYTCKPGYDVLGNSTWTCADNSKQYNNAYMICKSQPPTPVPWNASVLERSANLTYLGAILATPANPEQTISYQLIAQYPRPPANSSFAFSVAACSGAVRVNDPLQLDFHRAPRFTLTIMAWPDTQTISAVYYNVTIDLINIPDPPAMDDLFTSAAEGLCGPAAWTFSLPVSNPDGYPLSYSIASGNTNGQFVLDPASGNLSISCAARNCPISVDASVCPAGLNYAFQPDWTLRVNIQTTDGSGLSGSGLVIISVIDVNQAPTLTPQFVEVAENVAVRHRYIGNVVCIDMDAVNHTDGTSNPPEWSNITYTLTEAISGDVNGQSFTDVITVTPGGAIILEGNSPTSYPPGWDFVPGSYIDYNGRRARSIWTGHVNCTDGLGLMASNSLSLVILPFNDSLSKPVLKQVVLPNGGLSTAGGEIIRIIGLDFPYPNKLMSMTYATPTAGIYTATGCTILSTSLAECRSVPGYGYGLSYSVMMDFLPVNSTYDTLYYAPPRVDSVVINGAYTTAGSGTNRVVTINGANFGPPGTPVAVYVGADWQFAISVPYAAVPTTVDQVIISGSLGPGCGMDLPVTVVVGGQNSTSANPVTIKYPSASFSAVSAPTGAGYTLTTLSTLGGQVLHFKGANFGPFRVAPTIVTYTDASSRYTYTMLCSQTAATPHTDMDCTTSAGVGTGWRFRADICGQQSSLYAPSGANTVRYIAPVITGLAGSGSSRASTEGSQVVTIAGTGFGPVSVIGQIPDPITGITYGKGFANSSTYSAASCYVSRANTQITCLTAQGTGTTLYWTISVGYQSSARSTMTTSYAPPVVASFTGAGAMQADTQAGPNYNVTLNGQNFGFDMRLVSVYYYDTLTGVRSSDNQIPASGAIPGRWTYAPVECVMTTPHRAIRCMMPPGAGTDLIWKVTVDGQLSTDPVTDFHIPVVNSVYLLANGPAGSTIASPDGGEVAVITGSNFGPMPLIQNVSYGPTGYEYVIGNWTWISHGQLQITTAPGVGINLKFVVTVADQSCAPTPTTLSYAAPTILSVTPSHGPTLVDPSRRTVTIRGTGFGLLNSAVDVLIAFGNYNDTPTIARLPITSRSPLLSQVTDPQWRPASSPVLYSLTFELPEALGLNRTVRVVPYLRSAPPTDDDVKAQAPQAVNPQAAQYSFDDPYVNFVATRRLIDDAECATATALFTGLIAQLGGLAGNCSQLRALEISGSNFGPNSDVTGDAVGRKLQFEYSCDAPGNLCYDERYVVPFNWTHTSVMAYSLLDSGALRVRIVSHAYDGTPLPQLSNRVSFASVSPQVSGLNGQPPEGYRTEGYAQLMANGEAPQVLRVTGSELYTFSELYITVGLSPYDSVCPIVLNGQIVPPSQVFAQVVFPVTGGGRGQVTLECWVPKGQGKGQAVQIWKDSTASSTLFSLDYTSPAVLFIGYYVPIPESAFPHWEDRAYSAAAGSTGLTVPTLNARVAFEGTNFGACPSILVVRNGFTNVDACLLGKDVDNRDILMNNSAVTVRYISTPPFRYRVEFTVPAGEGAGWSMQVTAAGVSTTDTNTVVGLAYRAPVVDSISPVVGPTSGRNADGSPFVLTVNGANFGTGMFYMPLVSLVSPYRVGGLPCASVVLVSHFQLVCALPAGTGWRLAARVSVGGQSGAGGNFSYQAPTMSRITLLDPAVAMPPGVAVNSAYWAGLSIPSGINNSIAITAAGYSPATPLRWRTAGGAVVIIDGTQFGPGPDDLACGLLGATDCGVDNCAVVTEPATTSTGSAASYVCNNAEDYLGEGEVPQARELFWSQTRVAFYLPSGAGGVRSIMVTPGGQPPATAGERAVNFQYDAPQSQLFARPAGPVSTNGGGIMELRGYSFPVAPVSWFFNKTMQQNISFPYALPLPGPYDNLVLPAFANGSAAATDSAAYIAALLTPPMLPRLRAFPSENVRLLLNNDTSRPFCMGTPTTPAGVGVRATPGFDGCLNVAAIVDMLSYNDTMYNPDGVDKIVFSLPPGVGVNKSVVVQVLSTYTGEVLASSPPALYSYDRPIVRRVVDSYGSSLVRDDGTGNPGMRIFGDNFGRSADEQYFTDAEKQVELFVGGWLAANASRQYTAEDGDYVAFTLPPGAPAGYSSMQLRVAGQWAVSTPRNKSALFVGCKPGFFAHANETCAPCPQGAYCEGWQAPRFWNASTLQTEFALMYDVPAGLHPQYGFPMDLLFNSSVLANITLPSGQVMRTNVEVDINGYHLYPMPLPGFFDLNSTTADMAAACPPAIRSNMPAGRDVCIVACLPSSACSGGNMCAEAYRSKAPYYRCSDCNTGYYKSAGDCIKCPDSPGMLFVGFALLAVAVATFGYFLNKYQFDIRVVSIGIDYFQVLSILANSRVTWPAVVRELYRIMSAFNLNIEIVAPECLVPDVSFEQKFSAVLAMPFVVLGLFALYNTCRFLFFRFVFKQRGWRAHLRNMAGSISVLLVLLFLMYLYVTKTILSVFECQPTSPPDGKYYLQAVFEECGKPGGVQVRLIPWAVLGIITIVMGYPAFVLTMLLRHRETAMEDQLLRALDMSVPQASWTALFRAMMGRSYYQFKPDYVWWLILVLTRKFFIAFSSLMFNRNPAFQMAFCLLVLFLAYAMQVRYRPYMPASEFDDVLEYSNRMARKNTHGLYNRLRQRLLTVDAQSKKRTTSNTLAAGSGARISAAMLLGHMYVFLTNYNTLEACLLFSASLVTLMGVMYQSATPALSGFDEAYYASARESITFFLMLLVAVSITYYIAVLLSDLTVQYKTRREAWYAEEARKRRVAAAASGRRPSRANRVDIDKFKAGADSKRAEETVTNPLFMNQDPATMKDAVSEAVATQVDPPNGTLWTLFRQNYTEMNAQVTELNGQLTAQRGEVRKLALALQDAGLMDSDGNLIARAKPHSGHTLRPVKQTFGPQQTGGEPGAGRGANSGGGSGGSASAGLQTAASWRGRGGKPSTVAPTEMEMTAGARKAHPVHLTPSGAAAVAALTSINSFRKQTSAQLLSGSARTLGAGSPPPPPPDIPSPRTTTAAASSSVPAAGSARADEERAGAKPRKVRHVSMIPEEGDGGDLEDAGAEEEVEITESARAPLTRGRGAEARSPRGIATAALPLPPPPPTDS